MTKPRFLLALVGVVAPTALAAAEAHNVPARYRTNTVDPRVQRVQPALQQGVFADPERNVGPLVQSLLAGVDDPFLKVKILHDWIAETIAYDVESFFSGARVDTAWAATLRRRRSVCHGYASVMDKFCQLAGIACVTISGYGRGHGYLAGSSGQAENVREANHAWNAVGVGERWYLVDVTWDAGHVEGRSFQKSYSTTYLFSEPRDFLYTHFPAEPKWQLLDPPVAPEQFAALPYLPGRFFAHGMRLKTTLGRVSEAGASAQIELDVPEEITILARLKGADGRELPRRTLVQRNARECRLLITFPQAGRWTVYLHSKRRGEPGMHKLSASLDFQSTAGTVGTFPMTYAAYDEMACYLYRPFLLPLTHDEPILFQLGIRGTDELFLVVGREPWQRLKPHRLAAGIYEVSAQVPAGVPVSLVAKTSSGTGYTTLVDFTPK